MQVPLEEQPLTAGRTLRFCLRVFCVWWIWHSTSFLLNMSNHFFGRLSTRHDVTILLLMGGVV